MATTKQDLSSTGNSAAELGAPPAKVKKPLSDSKIEPVSKQGACSYYRRDTVARVKRALR